MDNRDQQFQQLVTELGAGIARVAGTYTRSDAEREDLLQDIWLAVWRALPGFRGESSLKTFVYRIAHNRSVSELVRRKPPHEIADPDILLDEAPGPAAQWEAERQSARLVEAVRRLPLGLRQVVSLRLEGLGYTEISEIIGISESNVAVRLNRARKQLATWLGEAA